ncbi:hypothetical protein DL767_005014 [Monosporascus sp. MG133]|nr:hypothetical protein DL767_005014 [Monosporascus sp. MG133]
MDRHSGARGSAAEKSCVACLDKGRETRRVACGHHYCRSDLRRLVELAISDRARWPPRCCHQRGGEVADEDVSWALPDGEQYGRYLRLRFERAAPRHYCSRPQCSEVIDAGTADDDGVVVCPRCGAGTCARCRQGQHRGIGCDQAPDDGLNGLMRRERWRRCGRCGGVIDRVAGCNRITCYCGHEFCYICGEPCRMCRCPLIPPGVPLPATDNGPGDNTNNVPVVFGEGHGTSQHFPAPQGPYPQRPAAGGPPRAGPFMAFGMNVQLPLRPLPADQVYFYPHAWFPAARRHPFRHGGYRNGYAVGPIHNQLSGTGFGFVPLPVYQPTRHVHRTTAARENHGPQIPFIPHLYVAAHVSGARQPHQYPLV